MIAKCACVVGWYLNAATLYACTTVATRTVSTVSLGAPMGKEFAVLLDQEVPLQSRVLLNSETKPFRKIRSSIL
jgi:hypothetical protein